MRHAFNCSTQRPEAETKAGGSLWVQGIPGLYWEFQTSQGWTVKTCLKNKQANSNKNRIIVVFIPFLDLNHHSVVGVVVNSLCIETLILANEEGGFFFFFLAFVTVSESLFFFVWKLQQNLMWVYF